MKDLMIVTAVAVGTPCVEFLIEYGIYWLQNAAAAVVILMLASLLIAAGRLRDYDKDSDNYHETKTKNTKR